MTTRAAAKNKNKKPLETTLGKAPLYSSDDPIDLSHVRKPIDTSIFGLSQVLSLFETATDEVRRYVAYECDIMYECRMCRTIFRSLANFILHKRNYCRESYNHNDHTNCRNNCQENEFYVQQEDADMLVKNFKKQNSREGSPLPPKCDSKPKQVAEAVQLPETDCNRPESKEKKNLNSVLCRLLNKQESTLITEQCLAEDVSNESKSSEKEEEVKNNVALQMVPDSSAGVFQTMFRNMVEEHSKMDLMKTEVMEIHDILENNEAILGSDGKIVESEAEKSAVLRNNFICTVCNQKFSTKKTLTYHINYKHNNTRQVYQCPECEDTFANAWGVFRHLYKIHRKTPAQVKRLRNQIHANKLRKDEQPEHKDGNNHKNSASSADSQGRLDLENQQWMDDLEGDNDLQRCGGCGRKFERKAALHSHSQFCTKRIAVCNTIKENSAKRVQCEEKPEKVAKNSKVTAVSGENGTNGARRRKPLVAHRLCRIDYFKENQKAKEDSRDKDSHFKTVEMSAKSSEENHCKQVGKEQIIHQTHHDQHKFNAIIEIVDESHNVENKGHNEISVDDSTKFSIDTETATVVETKAISQNNKRCDSRSNSCDDVIYVDTIKLDSPMTVNASTVHDVDSCSTVTQNTDSGKSCFRVGKNLDTAKHCPTSFKNNIITRSKSNAISNSDDSNSLPTTEVNLVDEYIKINGTFSNCDIVMPKLSDNIKPEETGEISSPTESCIGFDIKLEDVVNTSLKTDSSNSGDENSSDTKCSSDAENAPQRNTIQIRCTYLQKNNCTEDSKRKINELVENPHLENSKRKKTENSTEMKQTTTGNNLNTKTKITLETKSLKYIDKVKHTCLPCNKTFKSHKSLIKHMAVHFSWYRYQCRSCQYMSYNRTKCDRHVEKNHAAHDEAVQRNLVLHIPVWKTAELSTDFTELCKKYRIQNDNKINKLQDIVPVCSKEEMEITEPQKDLELTPDVKEQEVEQLEDCPTSATERKNENSPLPNTQDPLVRKMIMEVIFGSDVGSISQAEVSGSVEEQDAFKLEEQPEADDVLKITSTVQDCADTEDAIDESAVALRDNSRPVRNRTAPVQKDFLYDLKHILKPKSAKDREISPVESQKETSVVKKQKSIKMYMKKTKSKFKKPTELTVMNGDQSDVNKSISSVPESHVAIELAQDINMNSKDLTKKHITGDCV